MGLKAGGLQGCRCGMQAEKATPRWPLGLCQAHGHHPLAQPAHPPPPSPTHVPGTQQVLRSAGPEVGTPDSVFLVLRGGQALSCSSWQLSTWQWPWHTVSAHYLGREGMCSVC